MRKTIYTLLILVGFLQGVSAQTYLNVPLISQKQSNWCWAASIEMIMKYHNFNSRITQCDILEIYQLKAGRGTCNFSTCDCDNLNVCNAPIELLNDANAPTENLEKILDDLQYNVTLTPNSLEWNNIKSQIDQCQPIIVFVVRGNLRATEGGQHTLVIDGYLERDCEHYLLIKDPWETCNTGCSYALNYDDLIHTDTDTNTDNAVVSEAIFWAYDIKPKGGKNICDIPKPIDRITIQDIYPCPQEDISIGQLQRKYLPTTVMKKSLANLFNCFPKTLPPSTNIAFQDQLKDLKKIKLHTITIQKITDPKQYDAPFSNIKRFLYFSPQYNNFQVVVSKTSYRERQELSVCPSSNVSGYWLIESFGTCSYICPSIFYCDVEVLVWVINQFLIINFFELVRYPPFNYNFRRFKYRNQYYYYSLIDYKDLPMGNGEYFKSKVAYPQSFVFQQLHKKSLK